MIFLCNSCLRATAVITTKPTMLVKPDDVVSCPYCGHGYLFSSDAIGRAVLERPQQFQLVTMNPEEFYRAIRGMGMPGEYGASPDLIADMFRVCKVVAIDVEPVGDPMKTLLHSIKLRTPDDELFVLHLGPSTHGAVVYRIEEAGHVRRREGDRAAEPPGTQDGPDPPLVPVMGGIGYAKPPAPGDADDGRGSEGDDGLSSVPSPDPVRAHVGGIGHP